MTSKRARTLSDADVDAIVDRLLARLRETQEIAENADRSRPKVIPTETDLAAARRLFARYGYRSKRSA